MYFITGFLICQKKSMFFLTFNIPLIKISEANHIFSVYLWKAHCIAHAKIALLNILRIIRNIFPGTSHLKISQPLFCNSNLHDYIALIFKKVKKFCPLLDAQ